MSGIMNPSATGDISNTNTLEPSTTPLAQTGGTPDNAAFTAFNLSTLSAAQVAGIESGALTVDLNYLEYGSTTDSLVATGAGVSGSVESALAAGTDPSAFQLLTNSSDALAAGSFSAGFNAGAVDITSQLAAALESGASYYVVGAYEAAGSPADVNFSISVTCFAAGTRIATPSGEVAVEALHEGDLVLAGAARRPTPITWIGERTIDLRAHPQPAHAAPVQIAAGAIADGLPARDLLVSPDHCIFADGRLIPARQLLNGATVTQRLDLARVHYVHVELDHHDILLSEGLETESYLDTGNRALFANAGAALILHPEFSVNAALRSWAEDSCAPLATAEEAGRVWQRLTARAAALGWPTPAPLAEAAASFPRLLVAGRSIAPVVDGDRLSFALPPHAGGLLRLTTEAAVPADLRPWEDDRRALGLCVRALFVRDQDGGLRRIAVDDPALAEGWWAIEANDHGIQRWTSGDAAIRLDAAEQPQVLEIHLQPGRLVHAAPGRRAA